MRRAEDQNVLTTRCALGSIREIVPAPSFELITQTQSSEAATVVGAAPTGIAATTVRETGSIAASEFGGATIPPSAPSVSAKATAAAAAAIRAAPASTSRRPTRRAALPDRGRRRAEAELGTGVVDERCTGLVALGSFLGEPAGETAASSG